jgi:hypothetical protein
MGAKITLRPMRKIIFLLFFVKSIELQAQTFQVDSTIDGRWIKQGSDTVLFYQVKPQKIDGKYERAPFIHPLLDGKGRILTENGPADHPYHRGLFWAWHQIRKDGEWIADGWVSENLSFESISSSADVQQDRTFLHSVVHWIHPEQGKLVEEQVSLVIHKKGKQYRQMDINLHLKSLQPGIAIGGSDDLKGYGGFCMRWINPRQLQFFQRDKHIQPTEAFLTNQPWMQFNIRPDENEPVTVLVLADNGKVSSSNKWVLRNSLSMQNNMFPGREAVVLPEEGILLRYRILIFNQPDRTINGRKFYKLFQQETSKR